MTHRRVRRAITIATVIASLGAETPRLGAHKPITSKYTYNEHVFPIFRDRCAACHVDGGVAPMSLVTYANAYPWAESIRAELVAGRMPPWPADDTAVKLRGARTLTPRELDIVLTWATGGTPEGPATAKPATVPPHTDWVLGPPDLTIDIPEAVTLPPGEMTTTREFVLPTDGVRGRRLRAIDLLPGTPAIVRRATVVARTIHDAGARPRDRVLALWVPGADTAAPEGAAFAIPADATLTATITYRKTWKYENQAVTDRSRVGFYFAADQARAIETAEANGDTLARDADLLAIRFDAAQADEPIEVRATRPDGSSVPLFIGTTAPEWPRRFWLERPLPLERGTRVRVMPSRDGANRLSATAVLDVVFREAR